MIRPANNFLGGVGKRGIGVRLPLDAHLTSFPMSESPNPPKDVLGRLLWIDPQLASNEDLQVALMAWEEAWVTWSGEGERKMNQIWQETQQVLVRMVGEWSWR